MKKETVSSDDISKAVLKVFSKEEISALPEIQLRNFAVLVQMRLEKAGSPPSVSELEGLKELALEHL
jgi:hypothetical protein